MDVANFIWCLHRNMNNNKNQSPASSRQHAELDLSALVDYPMACIGPLLPLSHHPYISAVHTIIVF